MIFDDEDLVKPYFPDKVHSGPAVAFSLSDGGDCIPYTINRHLRDYQREGVQFMYKHYIESRGCILGDDMGLGKTVQVISFLAAVLHKKGTREDIENNMPEFLLRTVRKQSSSFTPKKVEMQKWMDLLRYCKIVGVPIFDEPRPVWVKLLPIKNEEGQFKIGDQSFY